MILYLNQSKPTNKQTNRRRYLLSIFQINKVPNELINQFVVELLLLWKEIGRIGFVLCIRQKQQMIVGDIPPFVGSIAFFPTPRSAQNANIKEKVQRREFS